jgi:CelD/BcsL family acetyltransferase involved in cellulose biosynthesis
MHLTVHTDPSAFQSLASDWLALLNRSLTNTPFQRPEFQAAWWKHFGHGSLCLLTLRDDNGGLQAIAPIYVDPVDGGTVRWVGGEEIADYLDIIAPPDLMESATAAVWDWLGGSAALQWKRLQFSNTPGWTQTLQHLQARAVTSGYHALITQLDVCPVVPLPNTFDAYLKQLDSKQRHEINRKLRRAQGNEDPVTWYIVDSHRDIAAETDAFMSLMETASPAKAAFLTPQMRAAFHEIFAATFKAGLLQLAFLEVNGQRAAAYAQFAYANRIWVYNSGLNPEVGGQLSPGWVLLARLIEDAINNGKTEFDFMQGSEDYKYRFGGKDTMVFRLVIDR